MLLEADRETAPYITTKPLHHSQEVIEETPTGILMSLRVQLNFELEREILGFGAHIRDILSGALNLYSEE